MKIISITPFFDKVLPHTTAVVTEFRAKVLVFSGIAKERDNLGLHFVAHIFFICNMSCLFAPRFASFTGEINRYAVVYLFVSRQ